MLLESVTWSVSVKSSPLKLGLWSMHRSAIVSLASSMKAPRASITCRLVVHLWIFVTRHAVCFSFQDGEADWLNGFACTKLFMTLHWDHRNSCSFLYSIVFIQHLYTILWLFFNSQCLSYFLPELYSVCTYSVRIFASVVWKTYKCSKLQPGSPAKWPGCCGPFQAVCTGGCDAAAHQNRTQTKKLSQDSSQLCSPSQTENASSAFRICRAAHIAMFGLCSSHKYSLTSSRRITAALNASSVYLLLQRPAPQCLTRV